MAKKVNEKKNLKAPKKLEKPKLGVKAKLKSVASKSVASKKVVTPKKPVNSVKPAKAVKAVKAVKAPLSVKPVKSVKVAKEAIKKVTHKAPLLPLPKKEIKSEHQKGSLGMLQSVKKVIQEKLSMVAGKNGKTVEQKKAVLPAALTDKKNVKNKTSDKPVDSEVISASAGAKESGMKLQNPEPPPSLPKKLGILHKKPVKEPKPAKEPKAAKLPKALKKGSKGGFKSGSSAISESDMQLEAAKWPQYFKKYGQAEAFNYDMTQSFTEKTGLSHPRLGWGFILSIQNDRLEVLFESGIKTLISNYNPDLKI